MSFSDVSSVTSHFATANEGFSSTTSGTVSAGATTVGLTSTSGLTNGSIFVGVIEPGAAKEQVFTGTVNTATTSITSVIWTKGTNVDHSAGVSVVDYDTGTGFNMMRKGILVEHNQSGTHSNITATTLTATGNVQSGGNLIADTVAEKTAANGVTIDGLNIKDSALNTASSVVSSNLATGIQVADKEKNPYKFSVYRNAALTSSSSFAVVQYDTKTYDTGSNVDVVTNKGRFTAPIAGFYHFEGMCNNAVANGSIQSALYKNGSQVKMGSYAGSGATGGGYSLVAGTLQLAANDYVEVYFVGGSGSTITVGAQHCYFDGFLISAT